MQTVGVRSRNFNHWVFCLIQILGTLMFSAGDVLRLWACGGLGLQIVRIGWPE